jgi:hypothetical protein
MYRKRTSGNDIEKPEDVCLPYKSVNAWVTHTSSTQVASLRKDVQQTKKVRKKISFAYGRPPYSAAFRFLSVM